MNEGYGAWGELKSMLSNRGLGRSAKKWLYKGVIVPTALYRAVSRMDRVRNEEVRMRAGIERE